MLNNNPDTLALSNTLFHLPEITVTEIRNSPNDRVVTIVVKVLTISGSAAIKLKNQ